MDRPTVIVDLDNVVYDWCGSMARWLANNRAFNFPRMTVKDFEPDTLFNYQLSDSEIAMRKYSQWAVWDDWKIPKGEFIRWWRLGVEAGEIYGQGPLIPGARNALWKLSDAEWDIHIATSRLTKFGLHDRIVENTSFWLRDNNIPYRQLSFTDSKTRILADAIVDDRWDNMDMQVHGQCFEFGAPHNESLVTWDYVLDKLLVNAETVV